MRQATILAIAIAASFGAAKAEDAPAPIMAHLASFQSRANAEKGWRVLADQYSSVLYFQPRYRIVDIDGRGQFFRLYAEGDAELMRLLCNSLQQRKFYCALHDAKTMKTVR